MNKTSKVIQKLREDYSSEELLEQSADVSPFNQFNKWMEQAINTKLKHPNAMTLSTSSRDGYSSSRIVLLKGFDENGFVFFTNYKSRKGIELIDNPNAALNFFWSELEKQVRIEGAVEKVSELESDEYFNTRPRESKIGTWASYQSSNLINRKQLDKKVEELTEEFGKNPIPRPPFWGGFILKPTYFEFWQGRPSRLHDRLAYLKNIPGNWRIERLSP
jgi:pyridoxamine 5'-phosphate oxidase